MLTHVFALVKVRFPVYVPATKLAGTATLKVLPLGLNVTEAFKISVKFTSAQSME